MHCVRLSNDALVYVCDRANDRIQVFRKDGKGNWPEAGEVVDAAGTVRIASLGLGMAMEEIYEGLAVS